jgi:hypothetical protein
MPRRIYTNRIENLRRLIQECGSAAELCRRTGADACYLSQLLNKTQTPTGRVRSIGDALADQLETGMGKPRNWLDQDHSGTPIYQDVILVPKELRPLLSAWPSLPRENKRSILFLVSQITTVGRMRRN